MTRYMLFVISCLLGLTVSLRSTPNQPKATTSFGAASNRRQWLASSFGIATAASSIASANADPSIVSKLQSPIQDAIAPGHWIGQFIGINSKQETWDFPNDTPSEVSKAIVDVLEGLTDDRRAKLYMPELDIATANDQRVHVLTWTKLEWLDALDVQLKGLDGKNENGDGCVAKVKFYATGFLPTNIPGAPLLNIGMAWFPFGSPGPRGEMLQDFRLRALKGLVTKELAAKHVTPDLFV